MRIIRYFAFVDLTGFTSFTEARGDEEAVALLSRFRAAIRDSATRHGVRIAKWLGDGGMIVSSSARALLRSVIEVQRVELTLPIRSGVAGGRVLLIDGEDYIGAAVNLASRLSDEAQASEVLTTPSVARAARITVDSPSERTLPGLDQPVLVVSVPAASSNASER